ncbi:lysosomal alpha-glucosidase-like [Harmonia axyridis]|uniref:lysosomal alpha-glucosidase-like n=1 Tax=Harmonia axyridis TaxID=115357 RepID=UPI001E278112|nr:lysosomal alpha-glucosidase-like [Harmonia axyridis]
MTRIHNFFLFRARKKANICKIDTVSFDSFHNEQSPEKNKVSRESSVSEKFSPHTLNKVDHYEKFSTEEQSKKSSKPNFYSIFAIFHSILFFIGLVLFLLYSFDIIDIKSEDSTYNSNQPVKTQIFYNYSEANNFSIKNPIFSKELPFPIKPNSSQCQVYDNKDKLDCLPQGIATKETCEKRGCCWIPVSAPLGIPYCFYPQGYPTYNYLNVTQTAFGLIAFLKRSYRSAYPDDVEIIKLIVKYETESRLHIKIIDPLQHRFEPPYPEIPIVDRAAINLLYQFVYIPEKPGFQVVRKSDGTVIFDALEFRNLIFANQFLQVSGKLPSSFIYGIGEHQESFMIPSNWTRYTLFNHDSIPQFNKNLYGSHPFYLLLEETGHSHGVFLLNSNAMDILLQPAPAITYRSIGGILDFFFFLGPTPADVVRQYTDLIGRPFMPPYWGLGFHLCRFGYKTLEETKKIMQRNIDAEIPLDTQWNDLDYMNNSNDFTYDKRNFKGLPDFIETLHDKGMHYIPLIDAGVSASEVPGTYPPYDEGVKMDIFVKNSSDQIFIGKVWNKGTTVWPDFTHPNSVGYWTSMLRNLHEQISFDGSWIDMNEPSNFYSGSSTGCPQNNLEHPPYLPSVDGGLLYYKTMCMSCKQYAGLHYDVHNLFGFTEAIVTNFALAEIRGKRPMVISRSTFPGIGNYAGHWSGDVWSAWLDMKYSIPQLLSFSLYGVPLMGADICGFNGNTTANLCNRWMQLGAFYPFSRNHNTDDGIDQDPVAFGDLVIKSSRKALMTRYSLLPYLYTLFWNAHVYGDTVARPLMFEFWSDPSTFNIDSQFLWGPALMIIPVLEDNVVTVQGYLPKAIWYDFYSKAATISKGEFFNISAPLDTIPLFVRGGYIIPQQSPKQTTTESRKTPIHLLVALDEQGKALGQLYWDDGDSLNTYEEKQYSLTTFSAEDNTLRIQNIYRQELPPNLGNVTILGVQTTVTSATLNGNSIKNFYYDAVHQVLLIDKLNLDFKTDIVFSWK